MPRPGYIPQELRTRPFTLEEARAAGLSKWHLEFGPWRRLGPHTYAWSRLPVDPMVMLAAASLRLPPDAPFSGMTAAWLHGLEVEPCQPIEVTIPEGGGVSGKVGLRISRALLAAGDTTVAAGFPATTVERTLRDVARKLSLVEAVVLVDAALHAELTCADDLEAWIQARPGDRAIGALRRAVRLADAGAESPMESRLRMLLVSAGLPRPRTQVPIYDRARQFLGRPDLYYADVRLGIEYDGATHRDSLAADDRRQNALLAAGVRLLRFTAGDIYNSPDRVVGEVRTVRRQLAA